MALLSFWVYLLIGLGLIIFAVISYLGFLWTNRDLVNRQNVMTGVQMAALHIFKFFGYGVLIFILVYLFFYIYGK
ncbi:hypothetical protein COX74_02660 [bacterium (Candidatus Gribaldobacteria) CG_4_10_14_0_2_um_filter_41_16]|uniref:Uncharacterized protein n=1 Tax=bacterium (Candidatus Gribaldobacteria) CG_4_10_14_0_2_um_filter_41_16 TaxID=2014265 RepID=A0A2M7VI23_9BACT|nr:MAG: hypothetical protein AUJ36_03770 [Parcubacteria group bacterium CG1_02_41_26]PJA01453.1 MAG: hypothetical protein COX74_02660 [bacterium (Candidatus Gribaldobacteria) CG_4_10_14_0_2_um_filter_41_16]